MRTISKKRQHVLPPILERYELKFTIPEYMVEPISDFVAIYCELDKYSEISSDKHYRINNLYFDTPNYLFLNRRLQSVETRFNMRIRSYSDLPKMPYFFEIKQKRVNIVKKFRAGTHDPNWAKIFDEPNYDIHQKSRDIDEDNKNLFYKLAHIYYARPKILTQYKRKAYVSLLDDYGRVTFDKDLRYMKEETFNLVPDENKMCNLDSETIFDPGASIVLELKSYSTAFPTWMIDLIRKFDLKKRSFSKYKTGIYETLHEFEYERFDRVPVYV